MTHPDEESLVDLALGDQADASVAAHVEGCASCRSSVDRTSDVVAATVRLGGEQLVLERPPAHVWTAITAEIGGSTPAQVTTLAPPAHVGRRRRRGVVATAVGFALGVAATAAVVAVASSQDDSTTPNGPAATTVAAGAVEPYGGHTGTEGSAKVTREGSARTLHIDLSRPPRRKDAFVQAWLLDPRTNQMIALGVMDRQSETFPLPDRIALNSYDSVDLSLEPYDGNPAHSSVSLARASLTAG